MGISAKPEAVSFSDKQLGENFVNSGNHEQAEFLLYMAYEIRHIGNNIGHGWWPMQCRAIESSHVFKGHEQARHSLIDALEELVNHLKDPSDLTQQEAK